MFFSFPLFVSHDEFTGRLSCPYLQFRTFLICRMAPIKDKRVAQFIHFVWGPPRSGSKILTKVHLIWTFLFSWIYPRSQPNNVSISLPRGPSIVCEQTVEDSSKWFSGAFQNDQCFGSASAFLFQRQPEVQFKPDSSANRCVFSSTYWPWCGRGKGNATNLEFAGKRYHSEISCCFRLSPLTTSF